MKFKEWFDNNLEVSPYPTERSIMFRDMNKYEVFINVSCENYTLDMIEAMNGYGQLYFWFPMNEAKRDIGLNSIFGAISVLFDCELKRKKVYLHCHAGVNRSPIVAESYHYLRTGKHLYKKEVIDPSIEAMFVYSDEQKEENRHNIKINYPNRLYAACLRGYLPPLAEYEKFLKAYRLKLIEQYEKKEERGKGGYLDTLKKNIHNF